MGTENLKSLFERLKNEWLPQARSLPPEEAVQIPSGQQIIGNGMPVVKYILGEYNREDESDFIYWDEIMINIMRDNDYDKRS